MKKESLSDALGNVDGRFAEESAPKKTNKRKWWHLTSAVAAMMAVIIGVGAVFGTQKGAMIVAEAHAIVEANYPETVKYPKNMDEFGIPGDDYRAWRNAKDENAKYYGAGKTLDSFIGKTAAEFLGDAEGKNRIYSPINVYMALCMLAEITGGSSRAQILDLIGAKDIDALRAQAYSVWRANYSDDGAVTSILANSLWLDGGINYNEQTLKKVAESYFASSYSGEMGSAEYTEMLRSWLSKQTGGLLDDMIDDIELSPETVIALASTIYFRAKWESEFSKKETKQAIFHGANGDDVVDFMNQNIWYGQYYYGEKFSATSKSLEGSGEMYFILPDEGVGVDELFSDSEALAFISRSKNETPSKTIRINLSVPKFDIDSKIDLAKGLCELGVTDVFDLGKSDFTPLTTDTKSYVSKAEHGARVAIDEEGVIAAAYTVLVMAGAAEPPRDEIDFVLDRPFIFVLTGIDGLPLFIGVVNTVK